MRAFIAMVLSALFATVSVSAQDSQSKAEVWSVQTDADGKLVASVHGNTTWGDLLEIRVGGKSCNKAQLTFSAYSYFEGSEFKRLKGKKFEIAFNGKPRNATIFRAEAFLIGHRAAFDLGSYEIDTLLSDLTSEKTITAFYGGDRLGKYFDLPENSWNVAGLPEALAQVRQHCEDPSTVLTPTTADCQSLSMPNVWLVALETKSERRYLDKLKRCLATGGDAQRAADSLAITIISAASTMPEEETRRRLGSFGKEVLQAAAESGDASAQHNFAALHNLAPADPLGAVFPVDYPVFMHWTRKAAAQQEPRAMFNLAVRLMDAKAGEPPDLLTAYILLRQVQEVTQGIPDADQAFVTLIRDQIEIVRGRLGAAGTATAEAARTTFDYSALAPR